MKTKSQILSLVICSLLTAGTACMARTTANNADPSTIANSNINAETANVPAAESSAGSQAAAAEAVVRDLYRQHDAKHSPFFQTKNRALVDKYFTKPLADLIWKDANASKGEVGAIDGDPLYNAQDTEIKAFAIGKAVVKGDGATVTVTFTNFGDKKSIDFALKRVGTIWKIDNIIYGDGDSLMKWLTDTYPTAPAKAAAFEGRFQVGDTTCTVKPVKMAFEVRWVKGKGAEMFFSKDGMTFESSPESGGANRFEFDDEAFTTGTFERADGKSFPVTRLR